MKRPTAAFFFILVLFALVLVFFLVWEYSLVKEAGVLPSMLSRWHFLRALVFSLEWSPLFMAAGILVSFGLFKDPATSSQPVSFLSCSRGMLGVITIYFLVYALFTMMLIPGMKRDDRKMRQASASFEKEIAQAKRAMDASDWDAAASSLELAGAIDRNDRRYAQMRSLFERRAVDLKTETEKPSVEAEQRAVELSANQYYLKALEAQKAGDLYTAHSLATKAYRIDQRRPDAQRLAAELWANISTMEDSVQEIKLRQLGRDKRDAYTRLNSGDPLGAYGLFLELKKQAPEDADIDEYLKQSLAEAKLISFFKDEVLSLSRYPSSSDVFFRVAQTETVEYILACKTAYFGLERAYLEDLELIRLSAGRPNLRVHARYAKLQENMNPQSGKLEYRLLLSCHDRENPKQAFLPEYLIRDPSLIFENYLSVPFNLKQLRLAALSAAKTEEASVLELISLERGARSIGVDPAPSQREFLMRLQATLAFLILSLFSLYLGYRFRHQGEGRPILSAILAFPLALMVSGICLEAWAWFNATSLTLLLRAMPQLAATIFISIQVAALALSFIILASYRDVPSD